MTEYRILDDELILSNAFFRRRIELPGKSGRYILKEYRPNKGTFGFLASASEEFSFTLNKKVYSGASGWKLAGITEIPDGVAVALESLDGAAAVTLNYVWHEDDAFISKNLTVRNLSAADAVLENVDVEKMASQGYFPPTFSWIYSDYGRKKSVSPYRGNMQDSLVILFHPEWESGIVFGNEAPGVVKGLSLWSRELGFTVGLTHDDEEYPFRKYLAPGEAFTAPGVFTSVFSEEKDISRILNVSVQNYVKKYAGARIYEIPERPVFAFNTWIPRGCDIDEEYVLKTAKAAAESGAKEYIIDDGWEDKYGDWGEDLKKFPHGLKPVFDTIKSLGMKPGLWVSIGTAAPDSKVFREHPEWFIVDHNGKNISLVLEAGDKVTACFATGWKDYITDKLAELVEKYDLYYLKADFSVVSSPYRYSRLESGCFAADHPGHRDWAESLYVNYCGMYDVFDRLHKKRNNLYIDCTYEATGGLQQVDYAMLKHAEGSWLSNFNGNDAQKTDLRIRQMAWWRSPATPASSLIIGNPDMMDPAFVDHILALAGAVPILTGDITEIPEEYKREYRKLSDWLVRIEETYQTSLFRQDLPGYFEPTVGGWDGYARINTDTGKGGIIGLFRHGSFEGKRRVLIPGLIPDADYQLCGMDGTVLLVMSGADFAEKGFEVTVEEEYGGKLFEIRMAKKEKRM